MHTVRVSKYSQKLRATEDEIGFFLSRAKTVQTNGSLEHRLKALLRSGIKLAGKVLSPLLAQRKIKQGSGEGGRIKAANQDKRQATILANPMCCVSPISSRYTQEIQ